MPLIICVRNHANNSLKIAAIDSILAPNDYKSVLHRFMLLDLTEMIALLNSPVVYAVTDMRTYARS